MTLIDLQDILFLTKHAIRCYYTLRVNLKDRDESRCQHHNISVYKHDYRVHIFQGHLVIYALSGEYLMYIKDILGEVGVYDYRNITIMHIKAKTQFKNEFDNQEMLIKCKKSYMLKLRHDLHAHIDDKDCVISAYNVKDLIKIFYYLYLHTDLLTLLRNMFKHKDYWFSTIPFDLYAVIIKMMMMML